MVMKTNKAPESRALPTPRIPAARGIEDGMGLGRVSGGRWQSYAPESATGDDPGATLYLARWAAIERGLA